MYTDYITAVGQHHWAVCLKVVVYTTQDIWEVRYAVPVETQRVLL